MNALAKRLYERYRSSDRAHGQYIPEKAKRPGAKKLEGKARTVLEPIQLELFEQHLKGEYGIGGIPIRDGNGCRWGAIDVDQYDGLDHAELDEKLDRLGLPLVVCATKSGGAHLYVFFSEEVPAALVRARLLRWAKVLGHPDTEVFPKQVTLGPDDQGNWINLPYFGGDDSSRHAIHHGKRLTAAQFLDLADAVAMTGKELQELNLNAPKPSCHGLVPADITVGQRDIKFFKAASRMRAFGAEEDEIRETLLEVNRQIAEPYDEAKLADIARRVCRKYEAGTRLAVAAAEDVVAELNQTYAIVQVGDKVRVLQKREHGEFTLLPREEFRALHGNRFCEVSGKSQPVADVWLKSPKREQLSRGIVFEPGELHVKDAYNLWSGWAVPPRPGDCSMWLEHVRDNICQGDEAHYRWVFGWFAHLFQQPASKPGTALVFRGKGGTGKTIVGKIVAKLLSPHWSFASRPDDITGKFNSHTERCLLLQAEEAFWAGNKEAEGVLKDKITSDIQYIERKGIDRIPVANHLRLLVTSNEQWVVPAGPDERRFAVFDVGLGRIQDTEYFGRMWDQMNTGGLEALLHTFLNADLSGVHLRQIPSTEALQEQKVASLTAEQKWWLDLLMAGELPGDLHGHGECSTNCLHHDYVNKAKRIGYTRRASETELGMLLRKMVPVGLTRKRRSGRNGGQYYIYHFPLLKECRAAFDASLRYTRDWGELAEWQKSTQDDPQSGMI